MEAYPSELLVGVFPLIFCVDATLSKDAQGSNPSSFNDPQPDDEMGGGMNEFDHPSNAPSSTNRSQFDRFLDVMASALLDAPVVDDTALQKRRNKNDDGVRSLFRSNDHHDDDSDEDILASPRSRMQMLLSSTGSTNSYDTLGSNDDLGGTLSSASGTTPLAPSHATLGGSGDNSKRRFRFGTIGTRTPHGQGTIPPNPLVNTTYAKALQQGQGFFQQARMVPISKKHGFPPSKDPTGNKNRVMSAAIPSKRSVDAKKLLTSVQDLDGILPAGWLEKHSHALPSVLVVVVQFFPTKPEQEEQDKLLIYTIQHLKYSVASKRDCQLQVVALVQPGVSSIAADQWAQSMADELFSDTKRSSLDNDDEVGMVDSEDEGSATGFPGELTLLNYNNDLLASESSSSTPNLLDLHSRIRDASYLYYSGLTKRNKRKLQYLGRQGRTTPVLLPLAIRYCFKIAMMYEWLWKHEKSLKYMACAYQYVENYYQYLVQQEQKRSQPAAVGPDSPGPPTWRPTEQEDGGGVELTLPTSDETIAKATPPPAPKDMIYQCRAVAEWLNFKLLQAGFGSHSEEGLWAASIQLQRHMQTFCNPRKLVAAPKWYDWLYISKQRLIASQLLERHPPLSSLTESSSEKDWEEVLLKCSPWRSYEAAAEALLQLAVHVPRALEKGPSPEDPKTDSMRGCYVGGLDSDGFVHKLQEESKIAHREKALDCVLRGISLYERDLQRAMKVRETDDEDEATTAYYMTFRKQAWSRSGARMYYLAGGILSGLKRYKEATHHLETAAQYARGWNGLELMIRRLLIECYEHHIPSQSDAHSSQTITSMILDSYFNAEMSNNNLRRALENFSSLRSGAIQWYRYCIDEADSSLPFSFAVTFPSTTHAIAGDAVKASVLIKSNLDYAVHVNSVTLLSMAGQIAVPSHDLLCAKNANEGSDGGIIIQGNTEVLVSTQIVLPKDLDSIATDEAGNGGEKEGTAGKGSFSKSARPRSAGLTSGAGARLIPEDSNAGTEGGAQWNLRFLGGKPLRCDGMRLVFYPVYTSGSASQGGSEIELTIEKKQPQTIAKIKRTPFEQDNFIASAWTRPRHLPMNRGPRCLRVLPPSAQAIISNVTEQCTNGKALEGTVNRILLRLQAGKLETCSDIKVKVSCGSVLINPEGITKRLRTKEAMEQEEGLAEDIHNAKVRTPVLVSRDPNADPQNTEYGYQLPAGWIMKGNGQGEDDDYTPVIATLKSNEFTYLYFDIYRPSPPITRMEGVVQVGEQEEDIACERDMCQTSFDVSICYRQERPSKQAQIPVKRRARKRPVMTAPPPPGSGMEESTPSASGKVEDKADLVYLDYSGSVVWSSPISAVFSPGIKHAYPSGNRHPSNTLPDQETSTEGIEAHPQESELVLIDGERVSTKCVLESVSSADGLVCEVSEVRFENDPDEFVPCVFQLVSGSGPKRDGPLYQASGNDPSCKLGLGSKLSLVWSTDVKMKKDYLKGSVSSPLGIISVDWSPVALDLPGDIGAGNNGAPITAHGPLRMATTTSCRFMGPPCYIENAPFETKLENFQAVPKVAVPFELRYLITNKTSIGQTLRVMLETTSDEADESSNILISGTVNGEVALGPFETQQLSYTALAMRTGRATMPRFSVSSVRYKTWVVREGTSTGRSFFVVP